MAGQNCRGTGDKIAYEFGMSWMARRPLAGDHKPRSCTAGRGGRTTEPPRLRHEHRWQENEARKLCKRVVMVDSCEIGEKITARADKCKVQLRQVERPQLLVGMPRLGRGSRRLALGAKRNGATIALINMTPPITLALRQVFSMTPTGAAARLSGATAANLDSATGCCYIAAPNFLRSKIPLYAAAIRLLTRVGSKEWSER